MKIHGSDLIPVGRYALVRDGSVVMVGPVGNLSDHYRPGDVVCLSRATFEAIRKTTSLTPET